MLMLILRSFVQTFAVPGLDAMSRALGWVIIVTLVLSVILVFLSAYSISTTAMEVAFHMLINGLNTLFVLIPLIFSSYILAPTSILYGLLFQGRVARAVEARSYPNDLTVSMRPRGRFWRATYAFAGLLLISLAALLVSQTIGPIGGVLFYIVAAGALLGRDQFVSVASRYLPLEVAKILRRRKRWSVFVAGMALAAFFLIPVVNLMMPVFSTILMLHLFKSLQPRTRSDELGFQRKGAYAGFIDQYRQGSGG